jgi:hypothetical protein
MKSFCSTLCFNFENYISHNWKDTADLSREKTVLTDHFLVVAKLTERLALSNRETRKFDMERFYLKKLKGVDGKEQCQVETSNRFAPAED